MDPDKLTNAIKVFKDLSATVIINAIAVVLLFLVVFKITPVLDSFPAHAQEQRDQAAAQRGFYERHLAIMTEVARLARVQCRLYFEQAKREASVCNAPQVQP